MLLNKDMYDFVFKQTMEDIINSSYVPEAIETVLSCNSCLRGYIGSNSYRQATIYRVVFIGVESIDH